MTAVTKNYSFGKTNGSMNVNPLLPPLNKTVYGSITSTEISSDIAIARENENEINATDGVIASCSTTIVCPIKHPNNKAIAWAMDSASKGPLKMSSTFLMSALLVLAKSETTKTSQGEPAIYGIKVSSMLTLASIPVALAAAAFMPLFGAIVDYTSNRRAVGLGTAVVLVVINGTQSFVSSQNWLFMLGLLVLSNFLYVIHTTVVLAYLPDLSDDEGKLSGYTALFSIIQIVVQCIYVVIVLITTRVMEGDTVLTAQISHVVSFIMTTPLLLYSWTNLFQPCPALHVLPPGRSLITAGFTELSSTTRKILGPGTPLPCLRLFMLSMLFSPDLGSGNYNSIFISFETVHLNMTGGQIGLVSLLALLSTIPGSLLSKYLCTNYGALFSFRMCLIWWFTTMTLSSLVLKGPDQAHLCYFPFSLLWGVQFGWIFPSQQVLFCTLVPHGKETELMGIFSFFGQVMGWAPPLLFSGINELGWGMRLGLVSSNILIAVAFILLTFIDYNTALQQAKSFNNWNEITRG